MHPGRAGGRPTGPPTDPDVNDLLIRFVGDQSLGTTLPHDFAALRTRRQMPWTILGLGKGKTSSNRLNRSHVVASLWHRRLSQNCHARFAW